MNGWFELLEYVSLLLTPRPPVDDGSLWDGLGHCVVPTALPWNVKSSGTIEDRLEFHVEGGPAEDVAGRGEGDDALEGV